MHDVLARSRGSAYLAHCYWLKTSPGLPGPGPPPACDCCCVQMNPLLAYLACLVGSIALYLVIKPGNRSVRALGVLIGAAAVAFLLVELGSTLTDGETLKSSFFYYVGTAVAIGGAVRVITHPKPVFSALYFVLVVIATSELFLLMDAEFMAFALIIVYAGAILITYMFVLMLAQQSPDPEEEDTQAFYDRIPREPAAACLVGFIMIASLGSILFNGPAAFPEGPDSEVIRRQSYHTLEQLPQSLRASIQEVDPDFPVQSLLVISGSDHDYIRFRENGQAYVLANSPSGQLVSVDLNDDMLPSNTQDIGWALVHIFPVSLELAGIILLLAMFGAVVLSRRQVEIGEDELKAAAGDGSATSGGGSG